MIPLPVAAAGVMTPVHAPALVVLEEASGTFPDVAAGSQPVQVAAAGAPEEILMDDASGSLDDTVLTLQLFQVAAGS